jgi:UMF1 family MFS transporter
VVVVVDAAGAVVEVEVAEVEVVVGSGAVVVVVVACSALVAAGSLAVAHAVSTIKKTSRNRRILVRLCLVSVSVNTVQKNDPRTIFGWAMYDWANSAYITTFGAIVAAFFTGVIVPDEGWNGYQGVTLWSAVVSIGAIILFLWMPVIGAVADYASAKKRFLRSAAVIGALSTIGLAFVPDGAVVFFLVVVLVTQIGFVAANVFYDGFLKDISTDDTIDRVSSKGFAFGYIGGGLYVLVALVLILLSGDDSLTGLEETTAVRIGIAGSGVWWIIFTWFSLRRLPDEATAFELPASMSGRSKISAYFSIGFGRTVETAKKLLGFKHLLLFVLAYFFYNDATQTVIAVSGAYAEDTLNLEAEQIIITFLIVQFVAFGGALAFGSLAGRVGAKRAIQVSLVVWVGIAIGAFFLPEGEALPLYGLAVFVGFVLGGVQALSRSLYGSMIPEEASAEFYGFYSVFSKFAAIWGPLVFAVVSNATGSGRPAILSVIGFFAIGFVLLSLVDVDEARASRDRWEFADVAEGE